MTKAWFISDRSGWRYRYNQRVKESTGFLVGPDESDGNFDLKNNPQNKSPRIRAPKVLKDARPEVALTYTTVTWNPSESTAHGTAGDLVVRNASASGDIVYKQTLTSGTNSDVYIPDLGVRVKTKIHVTLPTSAAATLLIG